MHLTLAWATRVTAGIGSLREAASDGRGGRGGGGGAAANPHRRRRGHRRFRRRRWLHQSLRAGSGWHPVFHHAGQCLGRGRARWTRVVALLLENQGRHPYRQSRPRPCGTTISTWRRPTITWSRSKPRPARSAGTRTIADLDLGYFSAPAPHRGGQPCAGGHRQRH